MPFLEISPIAIDIFWAIVVIAMLIVEFFTNDFTSIWFAIGGTVSLILSICGIDNFAIQFAVFLAVSLVLLLSLNKLVNKMFKKNNVKTNVDALIGQEVLVLKDADSFTTGEGKINGLVWTIITENDEKVNKDDKVKVIKVVGNKLVVKK